MLRKKARIAARSSEVYVKTTASYRKQQKLTKEDDFMKKNEGSSLLEKYIKKLFPDKSKIVYDGGDPLTKPDSRVTKDQCDPFDVLPRPEEPGEGSYLSVR